MVPPQLYRAGHGDYLVHPQVLGSVVSSPALHRDGITPLLVLPASSSADQLSRAKLIEAVNHYSAIDDVFSADFLTEYVGIQIVEGGDSHVHPSADDLQDLETDAGLWNITSVVPLRADDEPLPAGPYFLRGGNIHQAWKCYADYLDAFSVAVYPNDVKADNTTFEPLTFLEGDGIWKYVSVPSRLYFSPTESKPLHGQRITIKDNYRLSGVKTTMSSRPYEATYGRDNVTADFAHRLVQLGAVIVGKSKMSAFASSEEPTDQWVDFHAPFNPRGDGYQTPAGSSNGAAAALSGYPWLDFSLGTDTSGSVRYPAAICGLYGLRYTSHTISMEGIQASCREFDTIGLLGRDLDTFRQFVALTAGGNTKDVHKYPKAILYPEDFLPYTQPAVQAILEEFVQKLEEFLGVKRQVINIAKMWESNPPPEGRDMTLPTFLDKTGYYPFYYDGYQEYEQFRQDHRAKFDAEPYVGPYMRWKWEAGSKVTLEQKNQGLEEGRIYRDWFANNVLKIDAETASTAIMVMPLSCYAPDYRDIIHKEAGSLPAHSENYLASILRLPQLVIPAGQVPYESRATGRTEYHPITVSLVGAEHSDLMLINLVRETLSKAGWSEQLLTGKTAWDVGNGTRNAIDPPRYQFENGDTTQKVLGYNKL